MTEFIDAVLDAAPALALNPARPGQGPDKVQREEATEVKRPERAKKSKAHHKHAKKKRGGKGEKKEQYRAISHKNPEKH